MLRCDGYDSAYQSNYQTSYDIQFVFYDEEDEESINEYDDFIQPSSLIWPPYQQTKSSGNILNHHH